MDKTEAIRKTIAQWIEPDVIAGLLIEALENEVIPVTVDGVKELWLTCLDDIGSLALDIVRNRTLG